LCAVINNIEARILCTHLHAKSFSREEQRMGYLRKEMLEYLCVGDTKEIKKGD
jgi:hypothetical protein